jgi:hypothetical protein
MGFYGFSLSGTYTLPDDLHDVCILDTDNQLAVTALYADGTVTAPDGWSSSWGIFAHYYDASTTGAEPVATGVVATPAIDPLAQCGQTPALASLVHWPVGGDNLCHPPAGNWIRAKVFVYVRGGLHFPRNITLNLTGGWSADLGSQYCAYGTQTQGSVVGGVTITTAIIDAAMIAAGWGPWPAAIFDALVGRIMWGGDLCTGAPPPMPTFNNGDFLPILNGVPNPNSLGKFWTALQGVIWPTICQCTPAPPGSPVPVPFPPPAGPAPSAAPIAPILVQCDNEDICTILNDMQRQTRAILAQLGSIQSDVRLIQRQHVPFAYVPGTLHSGLSGSGTITVATPLGFVVQSTSIPGYLSSDMAPVPSYFRLGEVSFGTASGWTARRIVTHNPHLFLDIDPDITTVAYLFEPGVTANIQELEREP